MANKGGVLGTRRKTRAGRSLPAILGSNEELEKEVPGKKCASEGPKPHLFVGGRYLGFPPE